MNKLLEQLIILLLFALMGLPVTSWVNRTAGSEDVYGSVYCYDVQPVPPFSFELP